MSTIVDSRTHASESKRKCQSSAKDDRLDALESHTPNVRKRVEALSEIQSEHDKIEANFVKERAELEAEFQEKYVPLYNKRCNIVSVVCEVNGEVEKGVPSFWLNSMKKNEVLAKEITERDEGPLKYQKDIKWCKISTPKGFKLDFCFDANPYFNNATLTKTYHVTDDEEILENAIGSTIRDKIIPHAVSWFTGEAAQVEYFEDSDTGDDQDECYEENDTDEAQVDNSVDKNAQVDNSADKDAQVDKSAKRRLLSAPFGSNEDNSDDEDQIINVETEDLPSFLPARLTRSLKEQCKTWSKGRLYALVRLTPDVRKRVDILREIQTEHNKIKANFFERAKLEAKFQEKYVPLYDRRFDIVNGVEADKEADKDAEVEKGVPKFWLIAMKTNELLAKEIMKPDEGLLEHLKDVKWSRILTPKGFKLDFYFDDNPYFKNSVLTKTYHMIDDDELILENIEGTAIEWKLGKNVTYKEVGKKRKCRDGWTVDVKFLKSFFNFFKSPLLPEDYNDIDEKQGEELQNKMNQDYDVGCTIRDKIIPHAASWFTGEAAQVES